jgi:hypothetical protein
MTASASELSDQPPVPAEPETKSKLTLPSAYTILFALIVLAAIATWVIPAGVYNLNEAGEPIPGTYHEVASKPSRILVDSLTAPINGLSGIENAKGNINYCNSGSLFGSIDIALFIIVIGGFLGVTMKTGAIQADPGLDVRLRARRDELRDGGRKPGLLCARHHGHDRRRVRRAHRRRGGAPRLRDWCDRIDGQPVRHSALAVVIDLVWKRLRPAELRPSPQSQLTQSTQA